MKLNVIPITEPTTTPINPEYKIALDSERDFVIKKLVNAPTEQTSTKPKY